MDSISRRSLDAACGLGAGRLGRELARPPCSGGTRIFWPSATRVEILTRPAIDPDLAGPHDLVEMGQRQTPDALLEPAVEPHPVFVRT